MLHAGIDRHPRNRRRQRRARRDLLAELAALDCLPQRYLILEVSADLRERQRALLAARVAAAARRACSGSTRCRQRFDALIIGNEVLDAMPVHIVTHA